MKPYTDEFFERLLEGTRRSALIVVPMVMDLIRPKRVVDVGCGWGTWLAAFRDYGAEEILGIDGDHVDPERLEIAQREFLACDLSRPLALDRHFDLAVCLEVAEHLPAESADTLVGLLTSLAPVVLFSAAVPSQGGTNHVNEQWPDYWAARFEDRGYTLCDCIRDRIWDSPDVECWYAQNILLFSRQQVAAPAPGSIGAKSRWPALRRVHPRLFSSTVEYMWSLVRHREAETDTSRAELAAASAALNRQGAEMSAAMERLERERDKAARTRAQLATLVAELEAERATVASLRKRACRVAGEAAVLRDARVMRVARWLRGDKDLWERLPAESAELRRDAIRYGFRRKGYALRESVNLQRGGIEYSLDIDVKGARGVALQIAVAVPGCGGVIGAELISPSNKIVTRGKLSLDLVTGGVPAVIKFQPTDVSGRGWRLRVFVKKSPSPVRILEFQRYRLPTARSLTRRPFCSIAVSSKTGRELKK
jgi:SAM-dependent methyltransferase